MGATLDSSPTTADEPRASPDRFVTSPERLIRYIQHNRKNISLSEDFNRAEAHKRLDRWIRGFSRGSYALPVGVTAGLSSLAVSALLGSPDWVFAVTMFVTLSAFNYWFDPNGERS